VSALIFFFFSSQERQERRDLDGDVSAFLVLLTFCASLCLLRFVVKSAHQSRDSGGKPFWIVLELASCLVVVFPG
jgi:hypothetical protein